MRDPSTASDDKLTEEGFVELALEPSAATLRDEGAATVTQLELLLEEQKKVVSFDTTNIIHLMFL